MTEEEKDARIAELEKALSTCNRLWNEEIAARNRVEAQYLALAREVIFGKWEQND